MFIEPSPFILAFHPHHMRRVDVVVVSAIASDSRLLQAKGHCLVRLLVSEAKGKGTMDSREDHRRLCCRTRTDDGNIEMDWRERRDRERRDRDSLGAASGWKSPRIR